MQVMTEVTVKVLVWVTGWLIVADPLVMVVQETKFYQQLAVDLVVGLLTRASSRGESGSNGHWRRNLNFRGAWRRTSRGRRRRSGSLSLAWS